MKQIKEILELPRIPKISSEPSSLFADNVLVGLELEIEGISHDNKPPVFWKIEHDGSLASGGCEVVLKQPLSGTDLLAGLNALKIFLKGKKPVFSERTSLHVHIDISSLTLQQLLSFVTLYVTFEKVLMNYMDSSRSNNHFCMDMGVGGTNISVLRSLIKGDGDIKDILNHVSRSDGFKYSGCNLASIGKYGSLEFRAHQGISKRPQMVRWINLLLSLRTYALSHTPAEILSFKQDTSEDGLFQEVLGNYSAFLEYPKLSKDILIGARIAQDFVYASESSESLKTIPAGDSLYKKFLKVNPKFG
jgi:hypothetical protein